MEIKNEEKFSSFTESIKQLDKQGFELMSDIKLLFDEISKKIAMTSTTICQNPHTPSYQLETAEYHMVVYGIKMKPKIGQKRVSKTPENHSVNSQR